MEINAEANSITNLSVKAKLVEERENGEVIDTHVVTTVSFEVECCPGKFDNLLSAVASGHRVDANFKSPQLAFANSEK
jgi:hypothetical protein